MYIHRTSPCMFMDEQSMNYIAHHAECFQRIPGMYARAMALVKLLLAFLDCSILKRIFSYSFSSMHNYVPQSIIILFYVYYTAYVCILLRMARQQLILLKRWNTLRSVLCFGREDPHQLFHPL